MNGATITLQVLYNTVCNEAQPTRYAVTPSEILLRHPLTWDIITQHLQTLQETGLIRLEGAEQRSLVRLTEAGIRHIINAA
ncbi:ArsR/SmtB family transcription factor [Flavihumibacter petaseus]|uniref:ArnR1-like winged helix-turn-helix domain-containing protein n=1 Tax=Flavihumibacter petaseus NBRC 106054 TaxID=1220578 RepID=A0A0E9N0E7_9BACT|nr:helix-turn-helix transcriptional regulator [Flavihumibacter petaseus]GAO43324.1 hypothetical protein FPE01S_02_04290 [Flavihumibacter petaseus NBRC 106054]